MATIFRKKYPRTWFHTKIFFTVGRKKKVFKTICRWLLRTICVIHRASVATAHFTKHNVLCGVWGFKISKVDIFDFNTWVVNAGLPQESWKSKFTCFTTWHPMLTVHVLHIFQGARDNKVEKRTQEKAKETSPSSSRNGDMLRYKTLSLNSQGDLMLRYIFLMVLKYYPWCCGTDFFLHPCTAKLHVTLRNFIVHLHSTGTLLRVSSLHLHRNLPLRNSLALVH